MRHIAACLAAASLLLRAADPDQLRAAQKELSGARYDTAAALCAKILRDDP
jgi:hypothetical protein